jgi:hypothetical protein
MKYPMTIEQTVEIPANYRLLLELPRSVPVGARAKVKINIPAAEETTKNGSEGVKAAHNPSPGGCFVFAAASVTRSVFVTTGHSGFEKIEKHKKHQFLWIR